MTFVPPRTDWSAPDFDPAEHAKKSAESLRIVMDMEKALGESSNDMSAHFHDDFRWIGNYGCGTKHGVPEFRRNWQLPLRAAFSERTYLTDRFIADGEWVSAFGHIEATHTGTFMGIAATGKEVTVPYMDYWHVRDGRIADNWVSVDFPSILEQLGVDIFDGRGWERFDRGESEPEAPHQ